MNKETKMISIPKEEYDDLIESRDWLNALEDAGVDNWNGCSFAHDLMQERKDDE